MQETYKNHRITIKSDDNAESPNDWGDEDVFLVYEHRQFQVNREKPTFDCRNIFDHLQGIADNTSHDDNLLDYYIFTVFAHVHSGINLSLGEEGKVYGRQDWDTSTTGFVLVKKDILKGSSKNEEDLTKEEAEKYAQGVIDTWNQYLSGEVYWFKIEKEIKCYKISDIDLVDGMSRKEIINVSTEILDYEEVDSCGGNYDTEENILEQCKKDIDSYEQK